MNNKTTLTLILTQEQYNQYEKQLEQLAINLHVNIQCQDVDGSLIMLIGGII